MIKIQIVQFLYFIFHIFVIIPFFVVAIVAVFNTTTVIITAASYTINITLV